MMETERRHGANRGPDGASALSASARLAGWVCALSIALASCHHSEANRAAVRPTDWPSGVATFRPDYTYYDQRNWPPLTQAEKREITEAFNQSSWEAQTRLRFAFTKDGEFVI